MYALSGLNGRINGGAKINKVENECCQQIGYVFGCNFFSAEKDGNCPPESGTVDEQ